MIFFDVDAIGSVVDGEAIVGIVRIEMQLQR